MGFRFTLGLGDRFGVFLSPLAEDRRVFFARGVDLLGEGIDLVDFLLPFRPFFFSLSFKEFAAFFSLSFFPFACYVLSIPS